MCESGRSEIYRQHDQHICYLQDIPNGNVEEELKQTSAKAYA